MKTKKENLKISTLKELIKKNAVLLHDLKKKKDEIAHLRYETRHLYIVYGQLRGIQRDQIERNHRLAKPLHEGLITELMAKYL